MRSAPLTGARGTMSRPKQSWRKLSNWTRKSSTTIREYHPFANCSSPCARPVATPDDNDNKKCHRGDAEFAEKSVDFSLRPLRLGGELLSLLYFVKRTTWSGRLLSEVLWLR